MKLKIINIILIIFVCTNSIFAARAKTKQLFDVVNKEFNGKNALADVKSRSVFDFEIKQGRNNNQQGHDGNKNLFETLSFSQVKEKNLGRTEGKKNNNNNSMSLFAAMENKKLSSSSSTSVKVLTNNKSATKTNLSIKSLFDSSNLNKNQATNTKACTSTTIKNEIKNQTNKSNSNSEIKNSSSASKSKSKEEIQNLKLKKQSNQNEKEIKKLKSKINVLLQFNEKLMKKIEKISKSKDKKTEEEVVSFIQKYDQDVHTLKQNIEINKNLVSEKVTRKEEEIKKLFDQTSTDFSKLQSTMGNIQEKVNKIKSYGDKKISELKTNFSVKDLHVQDKLEVGGISVSKKITAKSIDLGGIKLDSNEIIFNDENAKIVVGSNVTTIGSIIKMGEKLDKMIEMCGENFERCRKISDSALEEQKKMQETILENLRELREETSEILNSRHKKFR
jgi:hypothetical protein